MMTDKELEAERALFEADAEQYGFDLTRWRCAAPEPWSEYASTAAGHRWGGWLAARPTWQPIETAPKDGTPILIFDGTGIYGVQFCANTKDWQSSSSSGFECEDYFGIPTHWMPLPAPPMEAK